VHHNNTDIACRWFCISLPAGCAFSSVPQLFCGINIVKDKADILLQVLLHAAVCIIRVITLALIIDIGCEVPGRNGVSNVTQSVRISVIVVRQVVPPFFIICLI
jgi:hypothetical protein